MFGGGTVEEQFGRSLVVDHEEVHATIIVDVAEGQSATHPGFGAVLKLATATARISQNGFLRNYLVLTYAVGFAYAAQEADTLPLEATDQPLDAVVTEAETLVFG